MESRDMIEAVLWLIVWICSSPLVMLCMKTVTSTQDYQFPYPWLLLGLSNILTFVIAKLVLLVAPNFRGGRSKASHGDAMTTPLRDADEISWRDASLLGLLQGIEVGLGAMVIHLVSVSLRTEIHMMVPTFMYLGGLACGIESINSMLVLAILLMTGGGVLATYGNMSLLGLEMIPVSIISGIVAVIRWSLTQKWLAPLGEPWNRPSPLMLLFKMSPSTSLVCFIGSLVFERQAYMQPHVLPHPQIVALFILGIGCGVVVMLVAEFRAVQLTSALLLGLLTPLHNVSIILGDVLLRGTKVSLCNWFGVILCCVAAAVYGEARKGQLSICHVVEKKRDCKDEEDVTTDQGKASATSTAAQRSGYSSMAST